MMRMCVETMQVDTPEYEKQERETTKEKDTFR